MDVGQGNLGESRDAFGELTSLLGLKLGLLWLGYFLLAKSPWIVYFPTELVVIVISHAWIVVVGRWI